MSVRAESVSPSRVSPLTAFRFAFRELRGGVRGFYVLILCIALGVLAIAGVGSFSESLTGGLAREGRTILGGDAAFSLIHREATDNEKQFLQSRGQVSVAATMRAMARVSADKMSLVEIKAVDNAYPLVGTTASEPAMPLADALAERNNVFGALADPALLVRLDLEPGGRITVGAATFEIRAALRNEPDKLAGGIGFGPRLLISEAGLARDRPRAARQPRALALSREIARERCERPRRGGARFGGGKAIAGSRLGGPHPQQCLARARAQCRTFHAIPHPGRVDGLARGRRRRRQCGPEPSRPQARHDRGDEIARRHRRARLCHLPDAGALARGHRRRDRSHCLARLCRSRFPPPSEKSFRCRSSPLCIPGSSRSPCSTD